MSIWAPVRAELRRILMTVPSLPDMRLEMLSFPSTPGVIPHAVVGVPYVEERLEKGDASPGPGSYALTYEEGIYAVDLKWPTSRHQIDGENLSDAIRSVFYPGRGLYGNSQIFIRGGVLSASSRGVIPGNNWLTFPVRVAFYFRRPNRFGAAA
jgi:hypothetical protein